MPVEWVGHEPTDYEHVAVAHALVKLSWSTNQQTRVPPSCLSLASHYLSQDPLPSPSVITDCLLIVAIYMGCGVPNTMVSGERYARTWRISTTLLINSQCTI
jgi:hypothetical protein